jgi:lipoate-protein ligase A
LNILSEALKTDPFKFRDRAVKSVRSGVTNISGHLKIKMDVLQFRDYIIDHIRNEYDDFKLYNYTPKDITEIQKLCDEKYSQWEWNYGYSPKYDYENKIKTENGIIEFYMSVEKGYIVETKLYADFLNAAEIKMIEEALSGIKHDPEAILEIIHRSRFDDFLKNITPEEFVRGMF